MLASRTSSVFVCLRCELRLAKPRITALRRTPAHANFSRTSYRRDAFDESPTDAQTEQPTLKIIKEVKPLNRLRRKKGKLIHEQSAPLGGLKVLGQDADILLVNEVDTSEFVETQSKSSKKTELLEVPDILASLQADKDRTPQDTNSIIESLRPSIDVDSDGQQFVIQTAFDKLVKILKEGFTNQQLKTYYSSAKNLSNQEVWNEIMHTMKKDHKAANVDNTVERNQWQPGKTDISERRSWVRSNHRPSKNSHVNKSLLVDRILRNIWNLAPLEEAEALGELDMSLKPWQFALLERGGNNSKLNTISRSRKVQLQFHVPHSVLRITADKYSAEYAAKDIDEMIRNSADSQLRLSEWGPVLPIDSISEQRVWSLVFTNKTLDQVMDATHTNIYGLDKSVLVIRGLNKDSVGDATQTLLRHMPRRDSSLRSRDLAEVEAGGAECYMVPVNAETSDDRTESTKPPEDLGRWSLPIARSSELKLALAQTEEVDSSQNPEDVPSNSSDTKDLALEAIVSKIQASMNVELTVPNERGDNPWKDALSCSHQADFGQVLFPLTDALPKDADLIKSEIQSSFRSALPGLSALIKSSDFYTRRSPVPALSYNFVPAPRQPNFPNDQSFPDLNIRLRPATLKEQSKFKLSLTAKTSVHDLCLPDKAVDIRFSRSARLTLFNPTLYPETEAWWKTVVENIDSGDRLTAPSLNLQIPNWTIPGNTKDPQGTTPVHYLFSGVEMQEWLSALLLRTQVAYKTSRSGKFGQNQDTLKAFPAENGTTDIFRPDEQELEVFVKSCLSMADKITAFASEPRSIAYQRLKDRETSRPAWQTKTPVDVDPTTSHPDVGELRDAAVDADVDSHEPGDTALPGAREEATS